jgi:hypothetical protein
MRCKIYAEGFVSTDYKRQAECGLPYDDYEDNEATGNQKV